MPSLFSQPPGHARPEPSQAPAGASRARARAAPLRPPLICPPLIFLAALFAALLAAPGPALALPDAEVQALKRSDRDFSRAEDRILSAWNRLPQPAKGRVRAAQIEWIKTGRDEEALALMAQGCSFAKAYTVVTDNKAAYLESLISGAPAPSPPRSPCGPPPMSTAEAPPSPEREPQSAYATPQRPAPPSSFEPAPPQTPESPYERQPGASGQSQPGLYGERQPGASGQSQPSLYGERQPGASGRAAPGKGGPGQPPPEPSESDNRANKAKYQAWADNKFKSRRSPDGSFNDPRDKERHGRLSEAWSSSLADAVRKLREAQRGAKSLGAEQQRASYGRALRAQNQSLRPLFDALAELYRGTPERDKSLGTVLMYGDFYKIWFEQVYKSHADPPLLASEKFVGQFVEYFCDPASQIYSRAPYYFDKAVWRACWAGQ